MGLKRLCYHVVPSCALCLTLHIEAVEGGGGSSSPVQRRGSRPSIAWAEESEQVRHVYARGRSVNARGLVVLRVGVGPVLVNSLWLSVCFFSKITSKHYFQEGFSRASNTLL
jgi:hypothetical protein